MDVYWIIVKVNVVVLAGLIFCHRLSIWFSSTDTSNHILLERMRQDDFSFYSRIAMRSFLEIFFKVRCYVSQSSKQVKISLEDKG